MMKKRSNLYRVSKSKVGKRIIRVTSGESKRTVIVHDEAGPFMNQVVNELLEKNRHTIRRNGVGFRED